MKSTFTKGTPSYEFEVMMQTIPNFEPKGFGVHIIKSKQDREACDCKYCLHYKRKHHCKYKKCPYLFDKALLGTLSYKSFILKEFKSKKFQKLQTRIQNSIQKNDVNMFLNLEHKHRFFIAYFNLKQKAVNVNFDIQSILYLLTTTDKLWESSKNYVSIFDVDFKKIKLKNISTEEYSYFKMAHSIYDKKPKITISEIIDEYLISDNTFKILLNSILTKKYGNEILTLFKGDQNEINGKN